MTHLPNTPDQTPVSTTTDLLSRNAPMIGRIVEIQGDKAIAILEDAKEIRSRKELNMQDLAAAGIRSAGDVFLYHPDKNQPFEGVEQRALSDAELTAIGTEIRKRFSDTDFQSDY